MSNFFSDFLFSKIFSVISNLVPSFLSSSSTSFIPKKICHLPSEICHLVPSFLSSSFTSFISKKICLLPSEICHLAPSFLSSSFKSFISNFKSFISKKICHLASKHPFLKRRTQHQSSGSRSEIKGSATQFFGVDARPFVAEVKDQKAAFCGGQPPRNRFAR